ncbi:Dna-mediated transposase [Oopsacas minuta]|uniref:Dna-mediated transposase n=1 Tax=Oopsacas minuta TaxID=111878 RepID=A0AAV7JG29_9METZ|nr:Dna-mediated transposase [Oopsacas minuta]
MPRDLRIHFNQFSWGHVTPTLHKLLAHAPQIIADHNDWFGLEALSEEGLESCNKLVRRYRERLSRKFSFEDNVKDVFVRLISQSDPILASSLNITKNDSEPDLSELKSCQDILVLAISCHCVPAASNLDLLKNQLTNVWADISPDLLKRLIDGMPARMRKCVDLIGDNIGK